MYWKDYEQVKQEWKYYHDIAKLVPSSCETVRGDVGPTGPLQSGHLPKMTFALQGYPLNSTRKIISSLAKSHSTPSLCSWEAAARFCCGLSPYHGWTLCKDHRQELSVCPSRALCCLWDPECHMFYNLTGSSPLCNLLTFMAISGHLMPLFFFHQENIFKKPTNKTPINFSVFRLLVSHCPGFMVQSEGDSEYFMSSAEQLNIGLLMSYLDSNSICGGTGLERTLPAVIINP